MAPTPHAQGYALPQRPPRARLKPPNISTLHDSIDDSVVHRDKLRRVLDMLDAILDTTEDIVREAEVRFIHTDVDVCVITV